MSDNPKSWAPLAPRFRAPRYSKPLFVEFAKQLARAAPVDDVDCEDRVDDINDAFVACRDSWPPSDRQTLLAAALVLKDLVSQQWGIRVRNGIVCVSPPEEIEAELVLEKERVRQQELIKRDAQLRKPSVQKFIRSMERRRLHDGQFVSIFSLMRDGRELADSLLRVREGCNSGAVHLIDTVIDPYLQFVSRDDRCTETGLRLMDVWRYFRHTWTNYYTSVPGRCMMFLVRDCAAAFHPVIGIGALSSPIIQIGKRDAWIGWHPDTFISEIKTRPTAAVAKWLKKVVADAMNETYIDDFLEDRLLSVDAIRNPTDEIVNSLMADSAEQRRLHHRYARSQDHKRNAEPNHDTNDYWVKRARTHLFRSKRALALAEYLRAQMLLNAHLGQQPSAKGLARLLSTGAGVNTVRKIVKKAKADRVGIAMADISVCGAIQPYNPLLGGKLVSMLVASPEVIREYERRYGASASEIASSMAGHSIVRPAHLVVLATTSLYGVGSSQYNRVKIPCDVLGGERGEVIRYRRLGHSAAFGTSHYGEQTVEALVDLVQQKSGGQRVNSIFGEGASPKLRKVREGLDLLEFPSELLLRHHRRRIVYGVTLVRNAYEFLLGMDDVPNYLVPIVPGTNSTRSIADWWKERWLSRRIQSDEVLEQVEGQTLVHPIKHGARVPQLNFDAGQTFLFPDLTKDIGAR